jgi:hypothetical protein
VIALLLAAAPSRAQTNLQPEEFTTFAVNMGARTAGTTANLIITVDRWSSEAEKEKLFEVLRAKGQQALLDTLQQFKRVGYIRTPQTVGYDLKLAMQDPGKDGGRRVIIVTDRPISFGEASYRPQSIDYPFTVIELHMPAEGAGEGTMSVAAKIIPAGKSVIIENYDTQPVRLNKVETRKLKK